MVLLSEVFRMRNMQNTLPMYRLYSYFLVSVGIGGKKYNLINVERPETGNFVQLETFCKDKNFARMIYVIIPDSKKSSFKLGRGHDSDVKIADISVSRVHAQITLTPQGYLLQDNNAKFGTLLLLPSTQQEIDPVNGLSVQVNRTTLILSVKTLDPMCALPPQPTVLAIGKKVIGTSSVANQY